MTGEQKYEEIKQILLNYGFDEVDGGYRFIRNFKIDEIQTAEMEGDAYMLGLYNAWDIADAYPPFNGNYRILTKD